MRHLLLFLFCLCTTLPCRAQAVPFRDDATGLWGLSSGDSQLPAEFDSVTVFGWNFESTFFLWKAGSARLAGPVGDMEALSWLSPLSFDKVVYDVEGSMCLVRQAGTQIFHALSTDEQRRDGKPLFLPIAALTDYRVVGECIWVQSVRGEALLDVESYLAAKPYWLQDIQVRDCRNQGQPPATVFKDRKGRFAIGEPMAYSDFEFTECIPLGDPCDGGLYWVTKVDGSQGVCYPDGSFERLDVTGARPDLDLAAQAPFKDMGVIPIYTVGDSAKRWYGLLANDAELVAPIFPLEVLRYILEKSGRIPETSWVGSKFKPAAAFALHHADSLVGMIVRDKAGKRIYLTQVEYPSMERILFPADVVPIDQPAFRDGWYGIILASGKGKRPRYGIINIEGYAVVPPTYDSITLMQRPGTDAWAYRAVRKGVTTWLSADGEPIEE